MRFLVVFFMIFNFVLSQEKYPKDYFGSPLDIPLSISGYFGDLRPNHFHSGIDFRTEKREGLPIYAAADGFVSRMKISNSGYGKSIYIDHPNGFTTVYGHLQTFESKIQSILNLEHYSKKSYEIEMYLKPNEISIKKGDIIGYSGNTGGSDGPHLHFEIRDTKSEYIINPLFFGFDSKIFDIKSPEVVGVLVYSISENAQVNGTTNPTFVNLSLQKDGSYLADKIMACGTIGFSINAFDTSNTNWGKNGIYKLDTFLNGVPYYSSEFDTFSFDETKLINTFIDYPRYKSQKQRFQKLYVSNLFSKSSIKVLKNNGFIDVLNNYSFTYKIVLQDFYGNKNTINIPISYGTIMPNEKPLYIKKTPYYLKSKIENNYSKDGISVFVPENSFYEDLYLNFEVSNNELTLQDDSVALNENITISFDVKSIPLIEREKMFIGNLNDGTIQYNATQRNDSVFSIKTKKLGKFLLFKDEMTPKIYNPSFDLEENLDNQEKIVIFISDDLSGIASYNAYLNGKWILMEYENKLNRLTHNFSDGIYEDGKNEFKIIVTDKLGNSTTFESNFNKKK